MWEALGRSAGLGREQLSSVGIGTTMAPSLAGAWLGRIWLGGRLRSGFAGALLVIGSLFIFALEQWQGMQESESNWRALWWGPPALMLVAGALCLERAGYVKLWRIPKALGDGSYSIYLFHVVVVAVGYRAFAGMPTSVRLVGTLAAAAVVGIMLYQLIEKPLTTQLRRLTGPRTVATQASPALLRTEEV